MSNCPCERRLAGARESGKPQYESLLRHRWAGLGCLTLLRVLDALVEPTRAPGDAEAPLRWEGLSAQTPAVALDLLGHHVR